MKIHRIYFTSGNSLDLTEDLFSQLLDKLNSGKIDNFQTFTILTKGGKVVEEITINMTNVEWIQLIDQHEKN